MSHTNHDLREDFPEHIEQIHQLKLTNQHFSRIFEEYNAINHEINLIEQGVQVTSDVYLEELKFKRLNLKDEMFDLLKKQESSQ